MDELYKELDEMLNQMATEEDVVNLFSIIVESIKEISAKLEQKISSTKSETDKNIDDVIYQVKTLDLKAQKLVTEASQISLSDIKSLAKQLNQEISRIEGLIPERVDLSSLERKILEIENKVPIIKETDLRQIEEKLKELDGKIIPIDKKRIDEIERIAKLNQMPITTSFVNGIRAKNFQFSGATVSVRGDTAYITVSTTAQVASIVAGNGIDVDSTDPANPIVSVEYTFVDNEIVSGNNNTFTLANTPVAGSVKVYAAGQRLYPGVGYTISGTVITTTFSWSSGDILADYRK